MEVRNLTKAYTTVLFEDLSFLLGNNEKVGLIGLNGCGKTTLLRIIAGEETADSGTLTFHGEHVAYLPQEFTLPADQLTGEFLESLVDDPHTEMYRINRLLHTLSLENIDHYQYIETLSEGQKMKLYLTKILAQHLPAIEKNNSPILLLDEPTNHLDIDGILWLEHFINSYRGICIIISHDRAFLNNCVTKIFEIDEQKLNVFEGNYDDYITGKQHWLEARAREMTLQEKKRKQLEQLIIHAGRIANGKKRGRAIRAAKKRMEREVLSNEITEYKRVAVPSLSLDGTVHSAKKMLDVQDLSFSYAKETPILDTISLTIFGQEKVWLFGPNGSGKTTFIKLLLGSLKPLNGSIIWGNNTTVGYFAQDQSHLDKDKTVQQFFIEQTGTPFEQSFSVLDRYLFSHDLKSYPIRSLSPGQRARLSFAIFTQKRYDFLILDEPTNHLDISTKEVIEEGLADFRGNILLISHDRYFVDAIGIDRAITIKNKRLVETAIEP